MTLRPPEKNWLISGGKNFQHSKSIFVADNKVRRDDYHSHAALDHLVALELLFSTG